MSNLFDPIKIRLVTKLSTVSNLASIIQLVNKNNTFKSFYNLNSNKLNGLVSQIINIWSPQNVNYAIRTSRNPKEIAKTIINNPNLS